MKLTKRKFMTQCNVWRSSFVSTQRMLPSKVWFSLCCSFTGSLHADKATPWQLWPHSPNPMAALPAAWKAVRADVGLGLLVTLMPPRAVLPSCNRFGQRWRTCSTVAPALHVRLSMWEAEWFTKQGQPAAVGHQCGAAQVGMPCTPCSMNQAPGCLFCLHATWGAQHTCLQCCCLRQ